LRDHFDPRRSARLVGYSVGITLDADAGISFQLSARFLSCANAVLTTRWPKLSWPLGANYRTLEVDVIKKSCFS
jgi:hypothetical protein